MSHKWNEEHDLTSIIVKKKTRQQLRELGYKSQTYDQLIQELIALREANKN